MTSTEDTARRLQIALTQLDATHIKAARTTLTNLLQDISADIRTDNTTRHYCINGHEYTPENTIINSHGHRRCRQCEHKRNTRYTGITTTRQPTFTRATP